jgi:hypothetical protein
MAYSLVLGVCWDFNVITCSQPTAQQRGSSCPHRMQVTGGAGGSNATAIACDSDDSDVQIMGAAPSRRRRRLQDTAPQPAAPSAKQPADLHLAALQAAEHALQQELTAAASSRQGAGARVRDAVLSADSVLHLASDSLRAACEPPTQHALLEQQLAEQQVCPVSTLCCVHAIAWLLGTSTPCM